MSAECEKCVTCASCAAEKRRQRKKWHPTYDDDYEGASQKELDQFYIERAIQVDAYEREQGVDLYAVSSAYLKRFNSCIESGAGKCYEPWLPPHMSKAGSMSASHPVIMPERYLEALPTDLERLAMKIVYGITMSVPTETHIERWGN